MNPTPLPSEDSTAAVAGSRQILAPSPVLRRSELVATTTTREVPASAPQAPGPWLSLPEPRLAQVLDQDMWPSMTTPHPIETVPVIHRPSLSTSLAAMTRSSVARAASSSYTAQAETPSSHSSSSSESGNPPPHPRGGPHGKREKRPTGTRQGKASSRIAASEARSRQEEAGQRDAKRELKALKQDQIKGPPAPKEPPKLNDQATPDWQQSLVRKIPVLEDGSNVGTFACLASLGASWLFRKIRIRWMSRAAFLVTILTSPLGGYAAGHASRAIKKWQDSPAIAAASSHTLLRTCLVEDIATPLESATLWYKLSYWLNVYECVTGAARRITRQQYTLDAYSLEPITADDVRAPHFKAAKNVADRITVLRYKHIDYPSATVKSVFAVQEVVDQVATRIEPFEPEQCRSIAQPIASRISNLMVSKFFTRVIATGSAEIAVALTSHRWVERAIFADRLTRAPVGKTEDPKKMLLVLALGLLCVGVSTRFPMKLWTFASLPNVALDPGYQKLMQRPPEEQLGVLLMLTLYPSIFAPLMEEGLKSWLTNRGVPYASTLFGLFEYASNCIGAPQHALGPHLMALSVHTAITPLEFWPRLAIHSTYNSVLVYKAILPLWPPVLKALGMRDSHWLLEMLPTKAALPFHILATACGVLALGSLLRRSESTPPPVRRLAAHGYRVDDVVLPALEPNDSEVRELPGFDDDLERRPVQMSLGPTLFGVAPPMVDRFHPPTVLSGCQHRFASNPPPFDPDLLSEFKEFCVGYVTRWNPIPADADLSFETWIAGCPYTMARKDELTRCRDDHSGVLHNSDLEIAGFGKAETYMAYKHARGINSRGDFFKLYSGPAFAAIEKVVFSDPAFIKHIPVRQRPKYLIDMLGHYPGPFLETDYTSFERHFLPEILDACEFVLYRHMLKNYPALCRKICGVLAGENRCKYRGFTISVDGRRMSGEMCTSLGNGVSNLLLAKFAAHKSGTEVHGVVEGDDGLFYSKTPLDATIFHRLGFTIKMLVHTDLVRTSFCGLMMSDDLCSMTDPRKVLVNFGWTHSPQMFGGKRVQLGLLRAKAMSLVYEHPQCPIVTALGMRYITLTTGSIPLFDSGWYEQSLNLEVREHESETMELAKLGPTTIMRCDFAWVYDIPVHQQLEIESYLSTAGLGELNHWAITDLYQSTKYDDLHDYFERFVGPFQH